MSKQWIQLPQGRRYWPLTATGDFVLSDVAQSLSLKYRYNGFTRVPFSVAQHCINVARVLPEPLKLWGLLHDASEFVLGDVPSPIKHHWSMFTYRRAEHKFMKKLAKQLDLPWPMPKEVHEADMRMLATEVNWLFAEIHSEWEQWLQGVKPYYEARPSWFEYAHPKYYAELFYEYVTYQLETRP